MSEAALERARSPRKTILVCGGREFDDRELVFRVLDRVHRSRVISMLLHGGAPGADTLAGEWALSREVDHLVMPARWSTEGRRAAGPKRNERMFNRINPGYDGVIAFPGGAGTAHMTRIAEERGFGVLKIEPKE